MRNFPNSTLRQLRSVTNRLTLSKNPEVNQVVGISHILLAMVVLVVIVVPNTLQGDAKPLERSVMVVANLIILSQCVDPGINLSLKAKETLTIRMLPTNLMVVSRIRIKAITDLVVISMRSTTRITLSLIMNKTPSLLCSIHSSGTRM